MKQTMKANRLFVTGFLLLSAVCVLQAQNNSMTLYVGKAGTMISEITENDANSVKNLTINGNMNAIDFRHLRDGFENLEVLDLSNTDIKIYTGKQGTQWDKMTIYAPNCIPSFAFTTFVDGNAIGKKALKKVVLSEKIKTIEDWSFWGCDALKVIQIKKRTAPTLQTNSINDRKTAIFVPLGTRDEYRLKKNWDGMVIIEGEPLELDVQLGGTKSLKEEIQMLGVQPKDIHFLTIKGVLTSDDLKLITDYMHNLVQLDIAETSCLTLPDFAFTQKKYMLSVKLPVGLTSIGQRVFSGCGQLSGDLMIPEGVTSIGYGAFMGCDKLDKVVITGSKLTAVGEQLFGDSAKQLTYK